MLGWADIPDAPEPLQVEDNTRLPPPPQTPLADPAVAADGDLSAPGMTAGNPINTAAAVLGMEFEANSVRANDAYADRFLRVRGPVESVEEGGYGHEEEAAIRFNRLGLGDTVKAYVARSEGARVQPGHGIELICHGASKETIVELSSCWISRSL